MRTWTKYTVKCAAVLVGFFFTVAPLSAMGGKEGKTAEEEVKLPYENGIHYETEIDYPFFEKEPELNRLVGKKVGQILTDFHKEWLSAQEPEKSTMDMTPGFELSIAVPDMYENEDTVSFFLSRYEYTGGAHGSTILIPFNYSKKTKKLLTLKDVLSGAGTLPENWLNRLADEARRLLMEQAKQGTLDSDESMIKGGTEPDEKNFATFMIKDSSVRIIFGQYQVAPYSAGMPEVEIPLNFFK